MIDHQCEMLSSRDRIIAHFLYNFSLMCVQLVKSLLLWWKNRSRLDLSENANDWVEECEIWHVSEWVSIVLILVWEIWRVSECVSVSMAMIWVEERFVEWVSIGGCEIRGSYLNAYTFLFHNFLIHNNTSKGRRNISDVHSFSFSSLKWLVKYWPNQ